MLWVGQLFHIQFSRALLYMHMILTKHYLILVVHGHISSSCHYNVFQINMLFYYYQPIFLLLPAHSLSDNQSKEEHFLDLQRMNLRYIYFILKFKTLLPSFLEVVRFWLPLFSEGLHCGHLNYEHFLLQFFFFCEYRVRTLHSGKSFSIL